MCVMYVKLRRFVIFFFLFMYVFFNNTIFFLHNQYNATVLELLSSIEFCNRRRKNPHNKCPLAVNKIVHAF